MIAELLRSFHSTIMRTEGRLNAQEEEHGQSHTEIQEEITDERAPATVQEASTTKLSEAEIIARAFGPFYDGKVIQTDLRTLLSLVPRKRERADAYKRLIQELKELGVSLEILPRWKMNQLNKESDE